MWPAFRRTICVTLPSFRLFRPDHLRRRVNSTNFKRLMPSLRRIQSSYLRRNSGLHWLLPLLLVAGRVFVLKRPVGGSDPEQRRTSFVHYGGAPVAAWEDLYWHD